MSDASRFDAFIKKAMDNKNSPHKNVKQAFKEFSEYREQQSAASAPEKKPRKRKTKPKQPVEDFNDERPRNDGTKRSARKSRSGASSAELASLQRSVPDDEPGIVDQILQTPAEAEKERERLYSMFKAGQMFVQQFAQLINNLELRKQQDGE